MTTDTQPKTQGEPSKRKLSEEDKQDFYDYMNRQNFPSPSEFYGYADELESDEPISYPEDEVQQTPLFPLGDVDISIHAVFFLPGGDIDEALLLHSSGNWGECDPQTRKINDQALKEKGKVTSVFRTKVGKLFFVTTVIDRGKTRVMTPEDY